MQGVNNAEVVKKMSVSDKMKFFEKAMEEQHQPSSKPGKLYEVAFTYGSMCTCNKMYGLSVSCLTCSIEVISREQK
jgi:hypothetical protein